MAREEDELWEKIHSQDTRIVLLESNHKGIENELHTINATLSNIMLSGVAFRDYITKSDTTKKTLYFVWGIAATVTPLAVYIFNHLVFK